MNWYLTVLKKYATFSGRARRKEIWMFILINFIVMVVLTGLDVALGIGLLSGIYALGVLVPSLAVGARRMHDIGKSGWWQLVGLIPFIGVLVLIYFFVLDSNPGDNQYGPNPKGT